MQRLAQESISGKNRIAIAGAGFSGAVIAHELAKAGFMVDVFEERSHLAGNCHTVRDEETGILLHAYGPHIFHTDNAQVWHYVQQFDEFIPFVNRVKAISQGRVYSLPVNLMTINQFYGKTFSPTEARVFLSAFNDPSLPEPVTFEEQAVRFVGPDLYQAFFKGYTSKQWGVSPAELPASILKRLPVRFNYNDNYYESRYQGMPKNGYGHIVERMLEHSNIRIHLNKRFTQAFRKDFHHVFFTGPIDRWYEGCEGPLDYRTLDFAVERHDGDYQGNAVINYCDEAVPWTRTTEHKHLSPWENHQKSIIYKEYSRLCEGNDIPYYPLRLAEDKVHLAAYLHRAANDSQITFVGRLGTYRYLDMHITIAEALATAAHFLHCHTEGTRMPALMVNSI